MMKEIEKEKVEEVEKVEKVEEEVKVEKVEEKVMGRYPLRSESHILGIDFGSHNFVVCLGAGANVLPSVVPNNMSHFQTPSIVAFDGEKLLIGEDALPFSRTQPQNTVKLLKCLLCKPFIEISDTLKTVSTCKIDKDDKGNCLCVLKKDSSEFSLDPVIVSSFVFARAKDWGYKHMKERFGKDQKAYSNCVLAVPCGLNEMQSGAIIDSVNLAGFHNIHLIEDIVAAALYYGYTHPIDDDDDDDDHDAAAADDDDKEVEERKINSENNEDKEENENKNKGESKEKNVLFLDMGHSFLSLCLAKFSPKNMEVLGISCCELGGVDFDMMIAANVSEKLHLKHRDLDIWNNSRSKARLFAAIEKTKAILSTVTTSQLDVEAIALDLDIHETISRNILENAAQNLLTNTLLEQIEKVFEMAPSTINIGDVDSVEIIGGSFRIPFVQACLLETLEKMDSPLQISRSLDSASSVSMGATLFGQIMDDNNEIAYSVKNPFKKFDENYYSRADSERYKEMADLQGKMWSAQLRLEATENARNHVESFVFKTRAHCADSKFVPDIISEVEKVEILKILEVEGDQWIFDDAEHSKTLEEYETKLVELTKMVHEACPKLTTHLKEIEEQKVRDLAEALKIQKELEGASPSDLQSKRIPRTKKEKMETGKKRKDQGNVCFKEENYPGATKRYTQALTLFDSIFDMNLEEKKEIYELKLSTLANVALCWIKLKKYEKCISNCDSALEIDPENLKVLFRKGQALLNIKEYEKSRKIFAKCNIIDPNNRDVRRHLERAKILEQREIEKQKQVFSKMFQ